MDVVDITIQGINVDILCSRIITNMPKDVLSDFGVEIWFAILCRPNKMNPNSYPGHDYIDRLFVRIRLKPDVYILSIH